MFTAAPANWHGLMMLYAIVSVMTVPLVGWWILSHVLERLRVIPDAQARLDQRHGGAGADSVRLDSVRFRYPNADHDALAPGQPRCGGGDHVAVTSNGSGKTTLMLLLLAGRAPTSGTISRPGCGFGAAGRHRCGAAASRESGAGNPGGRRRGVGGRRALTPTSRVFSPKWVWPGWRNGTPVVCRVVNCNGSRLPRRWREAVVADCRRGHQHGRSGGPGSFDGRAVRSHRATPDGVGAHHPLRRKPMRPTRL